MKTEREVLLRKIGNCHRRIETGYTPVEGQETEELRLERLSNRLREIERYAD